MRQIIITLVLVNLAYLAWNLFAPVQTEIVPLVPSLEIAPSTLRLRSELAGLSAVSASDKCVYIEGFNNLEDANEFISYAGAMNLSVRLLLQGGVLDSHFRVYLPPFQSREAASSVLDEFMAKSVSDADGVDGYVITRGSLENAIVFGIFAQIDEALAVQEFLRSLGLNTGIGEVTRAEGPIVVQQFALPEVGFSEEIWQQIQLDRPYLSRTQNLC